MPKGLTWHVTGLWHPADTGLADLPYHGMIADPSDGLVEIPLNDSRTATVTVSEYDPIIEALRDPTTHRGLPYARCLKVYYRDQLVFWGPIKLIEYGLDAMAAGTVKLSAVDPSLRLQHHYLRRGDLAGALSLANDDKAPVTVDHLGLRLLRDAGLNTASQNTENDPDLGIINGTNDFTAAPTILMGVQRGDQVWEQWLALSQSLGPDFELAPIDNTVGAYAKLNTFTRQGSDVSAAVAFHYGTGKQNLAGLSFTDGAEYITHAHVLDRDLTYRFTEANLAAAAETGPYVFWDATKFDAKGVGATAAEAVLRAFGKDLLQAYSRPLLTCQLTLPIENDDSYVFGVDYGPGDTVGVAGRSGLIDIETALYRITAVRLRQANADNAVQPEIDTVPDRVAAMGDTFDGVEE